MKAPLLLSAMLTLASIAPADEPVYDIGPATNGGAQDFRVRILAGEHGWEPQSANVTVAWNNDDLVVTVHSVPGAEGLADPAVTDPAKWNSVEVFFGAKKGSGELYQVIAGTDLDPVSKTHRIVVNDLRDPAPGDKPTVKVESGEEKMGHSYTFHLPLKSLGLAAKAGTEASLQVYVNWTDAAGTRHTAGWHPEYRDHKDPAAMYRIRLAAKPSPDVNFAARASLDMGRPRVDIYSTKPGDVEVKAGGKVVATGAVDPDTLRGAVLVPATATTITVGKAGSAPVDCSELHNLETAGVLNMRPIFKECVFSGKNFTACILEKPAETEQALGKCILTPTFYDSAYNEVKTADKPGRYGAIVHVETATGLKFNRFVTLYRAPEELLGRALRPMFSDVKLPPELGLDPAVVSSHMDSVSDYFGTGFTSGGINRGPDAAILLAWLSETKADAAPDLRRTGPNESDQKWWYGLKKKTGNLRTDYFVHLPPDYDKDPQKKWPVILFLHGSGERGYDLKILARQPLVQGVEKRKDFPFILIAPQVSPGEWWSISELDDILDGLPAKYRIDPDRIYLTGLSMGGFGTWSYLAAEPGRFAAAAPLCGGGDPQDVERFKEVPIWVFHGDKDDAVPIQRSQEMVDALKKLGSDVKFTVFPGVDHFSWIPAYKNPDLYKWFLEHKLSDRGAK